MPAAVDFSFDFSSPYGYLASRKIEALAQAHGRKVNWRPILLGVAFKATGMAPLPQLPLKGPYSMRDFLRSARFHGIAYRQPENFPVSTLAGALNDPAVKERTKHEVDSAIAKGVFGSPYIVVDGEPFWGFDRFDQIERWLAKGPF